MTPLSAEATWALTLIAAALIAAAIRFLPRWLRRDPEKRERQRRLEVNRKGRIGDAVITEVSGNTIHYTYALRGVQYETSQDVASLRDYLPAEPEKLIGQAHVKYLVNNPANSILICEEWSGLPPSSARPSSPRGQAPAARAG